jgi:Fic family protein
MSQNQNSNERFRGLLNERQAKGGLSAENYIMIIKTSRATATRDLQDLVACSAFTRTGELRHTRYHLNPGGAHG